MCSCGSGRNEGVCMCVWLRGESGWNGPGDRGKGSLNNFGSHGRSVRVTFLCCRYFPQTTQARQQQY